MNWQPHDRAICVDARGAEDHLVFARVYYVADVLTLPSGEEFLDLVGQPRGFQWLGTRFERRTPSTLPRKTAQ